MDDTLPGIAVKFNMTVGALLTLNRMTNPHVFPGKVGEVFLVVRCDSSNVSVVGALC